MLEDLNPSSQVIYHQIKFLHRILMSSEWCVMCLSVATTTTPLPPSPRMSLLLASAMLRSTRRKPDHRWEKYSNFPPCALPPHGKKRKAHVVFVSNIFESPAIFSPQVVIGARHEPQPRPQEMRNNFVVGGGFEEVINLK